MDYETIVYSIDGRGIVTVTLNRPERLNAFTTQMALELTHAFDRADGDDDARVVIVTGRGRGFCSGADLQRGSRTFDAKDERRARERRSLGQIGGLTRDGGGVVALSIASCRKPVIAAINGAAVGIGATMTLPMDIRIAGESAKFGFVFTRRGIVPEAASSWFLPRIVGISQAMEWVATGRVFSAQEALAGGLVSRVVPDDELPDAAQALALEVAENTSAVAVGVARQLLWSMLGANTPWDAHRLDTAALTFLGSEADVAEGVQSFLEKRSPEFPMRVPSDYPNVVPAWPATPDDVEISPPMHAEE